MADKTKLRMSTIYLYIPNIIGYIRVLMNCYAFAICFSRKELFVVLYFISFVCDGLDGWFARKFNQVSTFGAVLDMVTDRISTACLLMVLSQVYRPGLIFLFLLALDISSHWLQMYSVAGYAILSKVMQKKRRICSFKYSFTIWRVHIISRFDFSTFLSGKASHKDVKDSTNWLFKAYYGNQIFMAYCCVACEVLYIILFLLAKTQNEDLIEVLLTSGKQNLLLCPLLALSLFGWTIKQIVNAIQLKTAADACVLYDITKKR